MPGRRCLDCPADISDRPPHTKRCRPCAKRQQYRNSIAYQRRRLKTDPEFRERERLRHKAKARKRRSDPRVREREAAYNRNRWAENADHRAFMREHGRRYRAENPERSRQYARDRYRRTGGHGYRSFENRQRLLDRDGNICPLCGQKLEDPLDPMRTHIDHILPVSKGGGNELLNLQLTHATCNLRKRDRIIEHVSVLQS